MLKMDRSVGVHVWVERRTGSTVREWRFVFVDGVPVLTRYFLDVHGAMPPQMVCGAVVPDDVVAEAVDRFNYKTIA
jgi:cytochrome c5